MRRAGRDVQPETLRSQAVRATLNQLLKFMEEPTTGRGSGGNVIAALASLVVPGLGQLAQGRIFSALVVLVFAVALWIVTFGLLGWLGHIFAALDAALWKGRR